MAFLQHIISIYDPYKKLFIIVGIFFIIFINCCNLNICIKRNNFKINSNIQENNRYNPPNNLNSIVEEPSVLIINIENNSHDDDNNDNDNNDNDNNDNDNNDNDNNNIMNDKLPTYSEIYK